MPFWLNISNLIKTLRNDWNLLFQCCVSTPWTVDVESVNRGWWGSTVFLSKWSFFLLFNNLGLLLWCPWSGFSCTYCPRSQWNNTNKISVNKVKLKSQISYVTTWKHYPVVRGTDILKLFPEKGLTAGFCQMASIYKYYLLAFLQVVMLKYSHTNVKDWGTETNYLSFIWGLLLTKKYLNNTYLDNVLCPSGHFKDGL